MRVFVVLAVVAVVTAGIVYKTLSIIDGIMYESNPGMGE